MNADVAPYLLGVFVNVCHVDLMGDKMSVLYSRRLSAAFMLPNVSHASMFEAQLFLFPFFKNIYEVIKFRTPARGVRCVTLAHVGKHNRGALRPPAELECLELFAEL